MRIMIADDEMPARRELGYLLEQCMPEAALCYAESGEMVLAMLKEKEVDVLFADIHLGDRNGMSMASVLRREYPDMQIVFATAYEDYAVKAFEMNALDYITKPFELKRVEQTVQKILAKGSMYSGSKLFDLAVSCGMEKLPVSSNKNILLVDLKDIVYMETSGRGVLIHTQLGEYMGNAGLGYYEKRLEGQRFYRIQKSYLINLSQVKEIVPWFNNGYCVRMRGFEEELLPIGRTQIRELKEIYAF
ncbi:MAG: LytR/AlgR family response regulator transcription factor [Roseburia sp.]